MKLVIENPRKYYRALGDVNKFDLDEDLGKVFYGISGTTSLSEHVLIEGDIVTFDGVVVYGAVCE